MSEYRDSYCIKMDDGKYPPGLKPGFNTQEEAELHLKGMMKEKGYKYSVVYVREYFNGAMDRQGKFTRSTFAEIARK